MANMPDSSQMVFSLGAFLLIKKTDSRVFESSNGSGKSSTHARYRLKFGVKIPIRRAISSSKATIDDSNDFSCSRY